MKIDPKKVIAIHAVPTLIGMDVHSHGLKKFGHSELQVHCTTLLFIEAAKIINDLADYLLNDPKKPKFKLGQTMQTNVGHYATFIQGDETNQLRIEGVQPKCAMCSDGSKENI